MLDKEGPPEGFGADQRVVVLLGSAEAVTMANHQILDTLQLGDLSGHKRGADDGNFAAKRARVQQFL